MEEDIKKKHGGKLNFGVVIAVVSIMALVIAVMSIWSANKKNENDTLVILNDLYDDAIEGGMLCEDAGNMTKTVWYNSIFKVEDPTTDIYTRYLNGTGGFKDFNESINEYFLNGDYSEKIGSAQANEKFIDIGIKSIKKVPKSLAEQYESAKEVRSAYNKLLNVVDNPTGNIEEFSANFNDADVALSDACNELKYLLSDKE